MSITRTKIFILAGTVVTVAMMGIASAGGTYKFHVGCAHTRFVAEWRTGALDPGREYLRVTTGTRNPGCTISDYNADLHGNPRVEVYEGLPAVGAGAGPAVLLAPLLRALPSIR